VNKLGSAGGTISLVFTFCTVHRSSVLILFLQNTSLCVCGAFWFFLFLFSCRSVESGIFPLPYCFDEYSILGSLFRL
jgi:hypothetical protein